MERTLKDVPPHAQCAENAESDQCTDSSREKTGTEYPGERDGKKGHLTAPASIF